MELGDILINREKKLFFLVAAVLFFLIFNASGIFALYYPDEIRHYASYVFLFVSILLKKNNEKSQSLLKIAIVIFLFALWFHSLQGRNYLSPLFELLIIPTLFVDVIGKFKTKHFVYLVYPAVVVYLINCGVSIAEYQTHLNYFYFDMSRFERFRSTGIWGHPLYTALIHCGCMFFILLSPLHKYLKAILWFLGLWVAFMYDARAAVLSSVIVSALYLFFNGFISRKNLIAFIVLLLICVFSLDYLSSSELGGKLFAEESSGFQDSSSKARLVAFEILGDLNFGDLMCGVDNQFALARTYGVLCAENAVIGLILVYGLPIAVCILFLGLKSIWNMTAMLSKKYRFLVLIYFMAAAVTNQSLVAPYVWYVYIIFFILFCKNNNQCKVEQ